MPVAGRDHALRQAQGEVEFTGSVEFLILSLSKGEELGPSFSPERRMMTLQTAARGRRFGR